MNSQGTGTDNADDLVTEVDLDGREEIELRLEREELYNLMLMAHQRDITLNQLVENILEERIRELDGVQDDPS